jgi:hypothetical protein
METLKEAVVATDKFTFTLSVGTVIEVESWDGQKINVTDFDNW